MRRRYRDWKLRGPALVALLMVVALAFAASPAQARPGPGTTATMGINGGASYASSTSVTLNLSSSTATLMRFCNSGGSWTSWQAFGATKAWTLTTGEGLKTVQAQFKTATSKAIGKSATITLDLTAPVTTDNTDGIPGNRITVLLTPSDALSGVASTQYRVGSGAWHSGTSVTLRQAIKHKLPGLSAGAYTVQYFSTDVAGNVEPVRSCVVDLL